MEPMDVEAPAKAPPKPACPPPTHPAGPFGGTGQVFNVPASLPINGTQSPFQAKSMSAAPSTVSPTYLQAMPACGAASPFAKVQSKDAIVASPFNVGPNANVFAKSLPPQRISLTIPKAEPRRPKDDLMSASSLPNQSPAPMASPAVDVTSFAVIPESMGSLTPSYPAALFGGLSADDEHVTVWEPRTGKTVAGNAAPYRRNLSTWLETHQGWEEKADELKSSKRRAAARRSKQAATCFASLCAFPIAQRLSEDALKKFEDSKAPTPTTSLSDWSPDDYVRLQEILFRVGRDGHAKQREKLPVPVDSWDRVLQNLGVNKKPTDVLYLTHHMLQFGIHKSKHELMAVGGNGNTNAPTSAIGIPGRTETTPGLNSPASASYGSFDQSAAWRGPGSFGAASSLPTMASGGLSAITNSFRTPKEPRITVWHPDTGKTISGNAAPCRRNLEAWMAQHPGWLPKAETQLSSSRRTRNKKGRPMSVPSTGIAMYGSNGTPHSYGRNSPEDDAIQGLLGLGSAGSFNSVGGGASLLMASGIGKRTQSVRQKKALTSSVSSSSAGDPEDTDTSDDEDVEEPMKMET